MNLSGSYNLVNDVDCSHFLFFPIGNSSFPFKGNLEGNNFKISNLTIIGNFTSVGLFSFSNGSSLQNIIFQDFSVNATFSNNVGLLAGAALNTSITNITLNSSTGNSSVSGNSNIKKFPVKTS